MTEASDEIDDFVAFYRTLFAGHPRVDAREGASAEEIDAFSRAAGRPLPRLYLGYLREFGRRDGELDLGDDAVCDVRAVLRYLQKKAGSERPVVPPHCVLISIRGVSLSRSLHYAAEGAEPRVVINDLGEIIMTIASSFKVHLYRQAWSRRWFQSRAVVNMSRAGRSLYAEVPPLAAAEGFTPMWFSDEYRFCAVRGDARLYCDTGVERTALHLFSPNPAELLALTSRFKTALKLGG